MAALKRQATVDLGNHMESIKLIIAFDETTDFTRFPFLFFFGAICDVQDNDDDNSWLSEQHICTSCEWPGCACLLARNRFCYHVDLCFQFEWAWQQPKESRRLKHIDELKRRKPRESFFDYNFRILAEMLRSGPWNRLPLTIRWLDQTFVRDFPVKRENNWPRKPKLSSLYLCRRTNLRPRT